MAVVLFCVCCFAGEPQRRPELQLVVTKDGEHFQYWIAHPERVQKAWIEVLDRPAVIDRKTIEVQASGEFDWEWNSEQVNESELGDDDQLELGLWDPDGHTLVCDGLAIRAEPGGEVSKTIAGGATSFDPEPELEQAELRVAQGSGDLSFGVTGKDLAPGTRVHVFSDKGAKCKDDLVSTQVIDLAHARVTISGECFREPGILYLSGDSQAKNFDFNNVWIHVASRTSPRLNSVTTSPVPVDEKERLEQLSLVVRGSHFDKNSEVFAGYMPTGAIQGRQIFFDTEYISPNELHATVTTNSDELVGEFLGKNITGVPDSYALRLWVKGDDEKFELSESRDLPVQLDPHKRRKLAVITSISPFPIRPMNRHSPAELKITIHGENFVRENKVMAHYGYLAENLRTEYVSSSTLRAWIPRDHWRKHDVVYRLVIETAAGRKYSREVGSKDE